MRETMTSVLHILRKDFRHLHLLVGVWFLLTVLATGVAVQFLNSLGPGRYDGNSGLAFLVLVAAETMVLATIVSKLVHDDSIVGSTAFWLSRPISKGVLLASKILFLGIAIVLPQKLVLLYAASHLDIGGSLPLNFDWHLIALASTPTVVYLMVAAALTPSLPRMLLLGGIMASVAAGGFIGAIWFAMELGVLTSRSQLQGLFATNAELFALVGCLAVTCHQYLTRRTTRSTILAFSGILVYILLFSGPWFLSAS